MATIGEGPLELKQSASWQSVIVRLSEGMLVYFQNNRSKEPLGKIDLAKATVHSEPLTPTYKKFCFEIVVRDDGQELHYLFSAKSDYSRVQWLSNFQLAHKGVGTQETVTVQRQPLIRRSSAPSMRKSKSDTQLNRNDEDSDDEDAKRSSLGEAADIAVKKKLKLQRLLSKSTSDFKLMYNEDVIKPSKFGGTFNKLRSMSIAKSAKENARPDANLIFDILTKWQKPVEQHSLFLDLPKLSANLTCYDHDLQTITLEEILRKSGGSIEMDDESTLQQCKLMMITFASFFKEDDVLDSIEQYFDSEVKPGQDLGSQLKKFFSKYIKSESKVVALLKLLTHATLTSPYMILREKFAESGVSIKDISGSWNVQVILRNSEIHVVHEKKACSVGDRTEDQFDFVWHLQIVLDRNVSTLKDVQLSSTDLNIASGMDEDKKKKIRSIISLFLL